MSKLKKFIVGVIIELECSKTFEATDEDDAQDQAEGLRPEEWIDSVNDENIAIQWIDKEKPKKRKAKRKSV